MKFPFSACFVLFVLLKGNYVLPSSVITHSEIDKSHSIDKRALAGKSSSELCVGECNTDQHDLSELEPKERRLLSSADGSKTVLPTVLVEVPSKPIQKKKSRASIKRKDIPCAAAAAFIESLLLSQIEDDSRNPVSLELETDYDEFVDFSETSLIQNSKRKHQRFTKTKRQNRTSSASNKAIAEDVRTTISLEALATATGTPLHKNTQPLKRISKATQKPPTSRKIPAKRRRPSRLRERSKSTMPAIISTTLPSDIVDETAFRSHHSLYNTKSMETDETLTPHRNVQKRGKVVTEIPDTFKDYNSREKTLPIHMDISTEYESLPVKDGFSEEDRDGLNSESLENDYNETASDDDAYTEGKYVPTLLYDVKNDNDDRLTHKRRDKNDTLTEKNRKTNKGGKSHGVSAKKESNKEASFTESEEYLPKPNYDTDTSDDEDISTIDDISREDKEPYKLLEFLTTESNLDYKDLFQPHTSSLEEGDILESTTVFDKQLQSKNAHFTETTSRYEDEESVEEFLSSDDSNEENGKQSFDFSTTENPNRSKKKLRENGKVLPSTSKHDSEIDTSNETIPETNHVLHILNSTITKIHKSQKRLRERQRKRVRESIANIIKNYIGKNRGSSQFEDQVTKKIYDYLISLIITENSNADQSYKTNSEEGGSDLSGLDKDQVEENSFEVISDNDKNGQKDELNTTEGSSESVISTGNTKRKDHHESKEYSYDSEDDSISKLLEKSIKSEDMLLDSIKSSSEEDETAENVRSKSNDTKFINTKASDEYVSKDRSEEERNEAVENQSVEDDLNIFKQIKKSVVDETGAVTNVSSFIEGLDLSNDDLEDYSNTADKQTKDRKTQMKETCLKQFSEQYPLLNALFSRHKPSIQQPSIVLAVAPLPLPYYSTDNKTFTSHDPPHAPITCRRLRDLLKNVLKALAKLDIPLKTLLNAAKADESESRSEIQDFRRRLARTITGTPKKLAKTN